MSNIALTVIDVKKTKRVKKFNPYTEKPEMVEVWRVEVTSPLLPGKYFDLSFESEGDASKFSKGKSYTFLELIEIFTTR